MPPPLMVSSTPRLSEVARHVVIPSGIVTTAWPRVVAQCSEMGVEFDSWQHGIGAIALGKREDGKYAATVGGIVLSIPRQVGKTFLVGMIIIALCVLHPG
jgi:phage terminase large subunit-like protein